MQVTKILQRGAGFWVTSWWRGEEKDLKRVMESLLQELGKHMRRQPARASQLYWKLQRTAAQVTAQAIANGASRGATNEHTLAAAREALLELKEAITHTRAGAMKDPSSTAPGLYARYRHDMVLEHEILQAMQSMSHVSDLLLCTYALVVTFLFRLESAPGSAEAGGGARSGARLATVADDMLGDDGGHEASRRLSARRGAKKWQPGRRWEDDDDDEVDTRTARKRSSAPRQRDEEDLEETEAGGEFAAASLLRLASDKATAKARSADDDSAAATNRAPPGKRERSAANMTVQRRSNLWNWQSPMEGAQRFPAGLPSHPTAAPYPTNAGIGSWTPMQTLQAGGGCAAFPGMQMQMAFLPGAAGMQYLPNAHDWGLAGAQLAYVQTYPSNNYGYAPATHPLVAAHPPVQTAPAPETAGDGARADTVAPVDSSSAEQATAAGRSQQSSESAEPGPSKLNPPPTGRFVFDAAESRRVLDAAERERVLDQFRPSRQWGWDGDGAEPLDMKALLTWMDDWLRVQDPQSASKGQRQEGSTRHIASGLSSGRLDYDGAMEKLKELVPAPALDAAIAELTRNGFSAAAAAGVARAMQDALEEAKRRGETVEAKAAATAAVAAAARKKPAEGPLFVVDNNGAIARAPPKDSTAPSKVLIVPSKGSAALHPVLGSALEGVAALVEGAPAPTVAPDDGGAAAMTPSSQSPSSMPQPTKPPTSHGAAPSLGIRAPMVLGAGETLDVGSSFVPAPAASSQADALVQPTSQAEPSTSEDAPVQPDGPVVPDAPVLSDGPVLPGFTTKLPGQSLLPIDGSNGQEHRPYHQTASSLLGPPPEQQKKKLPQQQQPPQPPQPPRQGQEPQRSPQPPKQVPKQPQPPKQPQSKPRPQPKLQPQLPPQPRQPGAATPGAASPYNMSMLQAYAPQNYGYVAAGAANAGMCGPFVTPGMAYFPSYHGASTYWPSQPVLTTAPPTPVAPVKPVTPVAAPFPTSEKK